MIEAVAGGVAWLGASLVVLADGRLGLATGLGLAGAALGVLAWQTAGPIEGIIVLGGAAFAAALRLRSGPRAWNIMPAGSTPRLLLCIASALVAWWIAAAVMSGAGAGLRFTALTAISLSAARILMTEEVAAATTAAAALVLAVAVATALGGAEPGLVPYAAAAALAVFATWFPRKKVDAG